MWKVQLTMPVSLISSISSKDVNEDLVMRSKSDNTKFMTYDNANDVEHELFQSHTLRYQIRLDISISGSNFIFDLVRLFYYKCGKINFKRGESHMTLLTGYKTKSIKKSEKQKMINVFNV